MKLIALLVLFQALSVKAGSDGGYQLYTKADVDMCLAGQDNRAYMTKCDCDEPNQFWEASYSPFTDIQGQIAFTLRNVDTHMYLQHGFHYWDQVVTVTVPEVSILFVFWTLSRDSWDGYHTIRAHVNVTLNLDVLHGDQGIHEGSSLILFEFNVGDNQLWQLDNYSCP